MAPDDGPTADDEDTPTRGFLRGRPRVRRVNIQSLSFNRLLPNLVTLLALCAGLTAVRYGISERWDRAVIALVAAAFLDGIDGRLARMLQVTSKFGQELDSLADVISFGVAPAMLMYLWSLQHTTTLGWAAALLFAVCAVLRLARFNTMIGQDLPPWAHNYFTGVPTPAGAGLAILPIALWLHTDVEAFRSPIVSGAMMVAIGVLMVSRVPTFSGKKMRVKPQWVVPLMILIGLTGAFLVTDTWATLSAMGLAYLASIPVAYWSFRRLKTAAPVAEQEPKA